MVKKFILCLVILVVVSFSLAAGGGGQQASSASSGPVRLSYYEGLGRAGTGGHVSLATHPMWIELQKRLNIQIDFRHPSIGAEGESFNLMMASRDFPDIITYGWLGVPGGPGQYIRDDVIIKLNDVIDKWAPSVKVAFQKFPVAKREATMDDGTLYCFPLFYSNDALAFQFGPMVRRDILEKVPGVNMSQFPGNMETLEEWERMLTLVKNAGLKSDSGADVIPFSFMMNADWHGAGLIVGAFGIMTRYSQDNGRPVYGPADNRYREYLNIMKRWYDNGLIDREFPGNTGAIFDAKVMDGRVFALPGMMGGAITRYTGMARDTGNSVFLLNTLKYPVQRKGEKPAVAYRTYDFTGTGAAITTACKNVEAAARLLNYDFSDEGYILSNFGIEGQTFFWDMQQPPNYVTDLVSSTRRGYPRYMDIIMKNPDGYSRDIATGSIVRVGNYNGIKSPEFLEQRDSLPEQVGPLGRGMWMDTDMRIKMPEITPTQEESAEFGRIMNEINTYVDEMTIKFITGTEPLTDASWNNYLQTIQRMNLARALDITRAQMERYNRRP